MANFMQSATRRRSGQTQQGQCHSSPWWTNLRGSVETLRCLGVGRNSFTPAMSQLQRCHKGMQHRRFSHSISITSSWNCPAVVEVPRIPPKPNKSLHFEESYVSGYTTYGQPLFMRQSLSAEKLYVIVLKHIDIRMRTFWHQMICLQTFQISVAITEWDASGNVEIEFTNFCRLLTLL